MMSRELSITCGILAKVPNNSKQEERADTPKFRDILQINQPVVFKNVHINNAQDSSWL